LIQIQLMLQAIGVWVHPQPAALTRLHGRRRADRPTIRR